MDKSLDDIIKSKPRTGGRRGGRRGSAKASILGTTRSTAAAVARAKSGAAPAATTATVSGVSSEKIIVSNLPLDVNENQIRELFTSTIGPVKQIQLNYGSDGKSKGIASVLFNKKGDATRAHQQYNNRLIDGKRPMRVEMVLAPAPPPTLASRVAPAPAAVNGTQKTGRGGGSGARGKGRRRGAKRTPKSAEELDTEMEDYSKAETAPAAAA